MKTTEQQHEVFEFTSYLCITGDANPIKKIGLLLQYDPQNIVGDEAVSMDNKTLSFERLEPTPLRLLSTNQTTDSVGKLADERRTMWGTPTDAYCVRQHECDDTTLMFEFRTKEAPPVKVLKSTCEKFRLKFNLTYFSQDGKMAGTEVYDDCEHTESLKFEGEGYDAVLMQFLAKGISVFDTSADLFIEYCDEEGCERYIVYDGTKVIEIW